MGKALKIRKYNNDAINGDQVDYGFPNDNSTDNGYNANNPGIVGGINENSNQIRANARVVVPGNGTITADTGSDGIVGTDTNFDTDVMVSGNTILYVSDGQGGYTLLGVVDSVDSITGITLQANSAVAVTNSAWYYSTVGNSSIIRQKGSRKFLVALMSELQDESIAVGGEYMIANASNTDWAALGAGVNAVAGDVFTALKSGHGLSTNGTAYPVSTCVLVDAAAPGLPNEMSVEIYDNGDTYYASRLKNKFSTNFETPFGDTCNEGVTYSATFFNNSGNTIPDPAATNDLVYTEAGTENWC